MRYIILFLYLISTFGSTFSQEIDNWESKQDSIRNIILESKQNASIKESVLQELYIKNLVKVKGDSIHFSLPFNLHGLDCGAPDCYSTNVLFSFPLSGELSFPENIKVRYFEYGCVETEIDKTVQFQLLSDSESFILYHSLELNSSLVIIGEDEWHEFIYLFNDVDPGFVQESNFKQVMTSTEEESANVPYRSTLARMNEYDYFLK